MQVNARDPLLLAGRLIAFIMQGVMAIAAFALVIVVPVLLLFRDEIDAEIALELGRATSGFPAWSVLALLLVALAMVALIFVFFGKLRHIIETVGEGDPFQPANAERLNAMAWLLLGVQVLMIPAALLGLLLAGWADEVEDANVTIDAGLDLTGILMVIVLFILARVFRHGAALREDVEGTV